MYALVFARYTHVAHRLCDSPSLPFLSETLHLPVRCTVPGMAVLSLRQISQGRGRGRTNSYASLLCL